ncbi:putative inner membrane protein [Salmonella enterica subsp. enterica]|uniref:Putative inner membrane protein n=1 Tax=Salmonella enterica I TaxID=59201 RepID=A0A379WXA2_SALET|nr:putative inner membrane protein [Salmonella enterica subsp. enterica]
MKWQQRVRVATGLGCWQIMLHLLVVAMLVIGWMSGTLVRVGLGLCVLYGVTVLLMLALQRHHEQTLARCGGCAGRADYHLVLRHRADCPLAAIPRIAKQCLTGAGGAGYPGRARRGLATGER